MSQPPHEAGPRRERPAEVRIRERVAALTAWLDDFAPYCSADQKHLDENTPERAYWNYGYVVALRDVLALLERANAD